MKPYLTEQTLVAFCISLWPNDDYTVNKKITDLGNFRPDYVNYTKKLVVEFDGYQHYTQSKVILSDSSKTKLLTDAGYKVVRWPYFVQLDSRSVYEYFGLDLDIEQKYPHGFIDSKCVLPADFCIAGHHRFLNDLRNFKTYMSIGKEIFASLQTKLDYMDYTLVFPDRKITNFVSDYIRSMTDSRGVFQHNYS